MLDLETFGTAPGSVIRSVGAVLFDPNSDRTGAEFYLNIEHDSCLKRGLTVDAATEAWWRRQSRAAQDALLVDPKPLPEVVDEFAAWFRKSGGVFLWSQGANFDEVLWGYAIRSVGYKPPWKFSDARDTRTAYDLAGLNTYSIQRKGTYHNALDDAKHQARCVQMSYARVAGKLV